MKDFLGYGRSRSSSGKGDVIKIHFNEYVNCLHTQVGTARENMEVLVAEFLEPIGCAMRGRNPENPSERGRSNGKYKQRIEMGSNISNTITSVQKDSLVDEPIRDTDRCIQVGNIYPDSENMPNRSGGRVYSKEGCSPTILSRDFKTPKLVAEPIIIDDYNQRVPQGAVFDMSYPESTTRRGRVQEGETFPPTLMASGEAPCLFEGVSVHPNSHALEFKGEKSIKTDASPALRATDYKAPHCVWENSANYRIRKLTPRECFRLMGVSESDIEKIQNSGVSQSQQYKMAGNSIVVDVLEHIFRKLFVDTGQESQQLLLF